MPSRDLNLLTACVAAWLMIHSTYGNKFTSVPTTVKAFENDTVLLPCYVENSDPHARVRWHKGGELLGDTHTPHHLLPERLRMWHNRSLEISRLRPDDTASYTCEVMRQDPFSSIKQVHHIEVQYSPVVRTVPEDGFVEVQKGEMIDIACNVTANPHATLSWSKNGEPMALRDQRSRIKFKAENRNLGGVYECTASNGVGDPVKGAIRVLILDAPVVTARRSWVHTAPGLRAVLQAELEFANPPATTRWFKDGVQVNYNDRVLMIVTEHVHQLVFRNVREFDLGNYTFRAENRLGMADVAFRLSGVPNVATFKVDPSRNKATVTSFTLLWEVDSYSIIIEYNLWLRPYAASPDGTTETTQHNRWRKILVPGSDDGDGPIHSASYVVTGLTPGKVYEAFVTSRNRFGWSKPSTTLHFATESGVGTQPSTSDYSEVQTPVILEDIAETNSTLQTSEQRADSSSCGNVVSMNSLTSMFIVYGLLSRST